MSDWILAALVSGFGFKGLPTVHPSAHLLPLVYGILISVI